MKRIIIHWTGGAHRPNAHELECYHYLVDADGKVYNGKFKPEDNLNCNDGRYAQHTGGGNTGSVGVSLCGMLGFVSRANVGRYPITRVQIEACFKLCADLCRKYGLGVNPDTVMTHYEFGKKNPKTSSAGKVDIVYLPPFPEAAQDEVGSFIRSKVRWYLAQKR